MIKSLFDYEDDDEKPQPKENKSELESEESIKRQLDEINILAETPAAPDETETITQIRLTETVAPVYADEDDEIETIALPRIEQVYADAGEPPFDNAFSENQFDEISESQFAEIEAQLQAMETESTLTETEPPPQVSAATPYRNVLQNENAQVNNSVSQTGSIFQTEDVSQTDARPLTTAETIRQSGMAWSAAIGLFGSVLFMMILGWFFDLLTGASPVGLVGGIIIGSAIGFYQFFRTTAQIFKK
jgi:F0F1-type ATP synthase assembly protein I